MRFAAATACSLAAILPASGTAQDGLLAGFDAYVRQSVADWQVPGLAVAVVKDGELVFSGAYGVQRLGEPAPADAATLFAIGSTTKAMTAAAIGMLVEDGLLDWDDLVVDYLPDFQLHDAYVTREVTIRDLLTHRAGLGNADFLWYGQETTTGEILHRLRYLEPQSSMRSRFTYQNIMYAAAGEVIRAVSGVPWAEFVGDRIFRPLGMDGTTATLVEAERAGHLASPHDRVNGAIVPIRNASVDLVAPAGSVWSSVEDMSRWMRFLLAGGVTKDGRRLLEESTVEELFTPQVIVGPESFYPTARLTEPHWTTYALGWFQADYNGEAVDFHTGSIDGMVAICGLIRDKGLGVYVLGNLDHAEVRHALMYRVFDLYAGREPRDWSRELMSLYDGRQAASDRQRAAAEQGRVMDTQPSVRLAEYAGVYEDELYGRVEITATDGQLRLIYGPGLSGPLEHWHYDTFRVRWDAAWRGDSFVSFVLDRDGRPGEVELNGARLRRVEP